MEINEKPTPVNPAVSAAEKQAALTAGEIPIAVYGLGKMGLPLATVLAPISSNVIGIDIDPAVVEQINRGECPVQGEPGLPAELERAVDNEWLRATDDAVTGAESAGIHVVIVPTVLDDENEPDLSALEAAIDVISNGLTPGDLVIIESTVPPRTCSDVVQPRLEANSGLSSDEFGLAFCPERTASGRALEDIRGAYPKVVGGRDAESTRTATILYREVTSNEIVQVRDCTTAECVKLFEGVYRDVNIALANELAQLADEIQIDVNEAISVANGPEYCDIHSPGPGVGGHCIPYYPYFMINACDTHLPLLETARRTNELMPAHTVDILDRSLADQSIDLEDATVGLLGITYRAGVNETRRAPAYPIASILRDAGATVYAADPVRNSMDDIAAQPITIDLLPQLELDAVVLVTAHEEFQDIAWEELTDVIILDGRNALDCDDIPHQCVTLGNGRERPDETIRGETE